MAQKEPLSLSLLTEYFALFVNRRAYTIQAVTGKNDDTKCFYYRPKSKCEMSLETIRKHLTGEITIGLYAINPATQRCKWIAIDADYENALRDLLRLQWELRNDGIDSALERSRRGGHLWILAQEPLLACECRRYVQSLASRVRAPIRGSRSQGKDSRASLEGIEIFPKQDRLAAGEFGNAIRGPLGVHRRDGKRYWFYGAGYEFEAQLEYLNRLGKLTPDKLASLVTELPAAETEQDFIRRQSATPRGSTVRRRSSERFSILTCLHERLRKMGRNYFTRCPSCARHGRDKHGDNLAISICEPSKYRCWAGCTKEEIRAALGFTPSPYSRN